MSGAASSDRAAQHLSGSHTGGITSARFQIRQAPAQGEGLKGQRVLTHLWPEVSGILRLQARVTRPVSTFSANPADLSTASPDTRWSPLQRFVAWRRGLDSRACYPSCRGDRAERGVSAYGPACDARQARQESRSWRGGSGEGESHRHHVKNAEGAPSRAGSATAAGLGRVHPTRRGGSAGRRTDSGWQGGLLLENSRRGEPVSKRSGETGELDAEALRADFLFAAAGRGSSPSSKATQGFPRCSRSGAEVMRLRSAVAEQGRQAAGASGRGLGAARGIFGRCPGWGRGGGGCLPSQFESVTDSTSLEPRVARHAGRQ